MPRYNYICHRCEKKVSAEFKGEIPAEVFEERVLFETSHSMNPTPEELAKAVICPRCKSKKCTLTVYGTNTHGYIKGYGWADRQGITRDMNLHKLQNDDPYAQYRESGEADHIENELKKKGRHDPKTKYFRTSSPTESDVRKAINTTA